jgi:hypothetical protein
MLRQDAVMTLRWDNKGWQRVRVDCGNIAEKMFHQSILIVAHPDDEILWFSSVVDKVEEVVVCYLGCPSKAQLSAGRKKSLPILPLRKVSCLGLDESEVYSDIHLCIPVMSCYGVEVSGNPDAIARYEKNYFRIKSLLQDKLAVCKNVYTHNPWGEYGNEEHIQVFRAVRDLQGDMGFNLWVSSYCSDKSCNAMFENSVMLDSIHANVPVNQTLAYKIRDLYVANGCWTWDKNWIWNSCESLLSVTPSSLSEKKITTIAIISMILPQPFYRYDRHLSLEQAIRYCFRIMKPILMRFLNKIVNHPR